MNDYNGRACFVQLPGGGFPKIDLTELHGTLIELLEIHRDKWRTR